MRVRRPRHGGRGDNVNGDVQGGPGTGAGVTTSTGTTAKKKGPPEAVPRGARDSSGDLLSRARGPGTIGDLRLDFRVRDGNGYDPHSITAETNSCMEF